MRNIDCPVCGATFATSVAGGKVVCPACDQEISLSDAPRRQSSLPANWAYIAFGTLLVIAITISALLFGPQLRQLGTSVSTEEQSSQFDPEVYQSMVDDAVRRALEEERARTKSSTERRAGSPDSGGPAEPPSVEDLPRQVVVPSTEITRKTAPEIVRFKRLLLSDAVTDFAITTDRKELIVAHRDVNLLSVYDIESDKVVQQIQCKSPSAILIRNERLYVANQHEGTVQSFRKYDRWASERSFLIDSREVIVLSAPTGARFAGEILVTCRPKLVPGAQPRCEVFVLNVQEDSCRKVARDILAEVSLNGGTVVAHNDFNQSPRGTLGTYEYRRFVNHDGIERLKPDYNGVHDDTPRVKQLYPGSYWCSRFSVFGGNPIRELKLFPGYVVPDVDHRRLFVVNSDQVSVHSLDSRFAELASWDAKLPVNPADPKVYARRERNYQFFTALATEQQGRSVLFYHEATAIMRGDVRLDAGSGLDKQLAGIGPSPPKQPQASSSVQVDPQERTLSQTPTSPQDPSPSDAAADTGEPFSNQKVAFREIQLPEPATCMAMTDDGAFLAITHESANAVTFYDVENQKVEHVAYMERPRSLLIRGNDVFVASYSDAAINVFSRTYGWSQTDELVVDQSRIVHISAPQGRHFDGKILVSCHGEGHVYDAARSASFFLVDAHKDECEKIGGGEGVLSVGFDGKMVFAHGYVFYLDDYVKNGRRKAQAFDAQQLRRDFPYQAHAGSYWLGTSRIAGGDPLEIMEDNLSLVVPDLSQKIVYSLSPTVMRAMRLNTRTSVAGKRRVELPSGNRIPGDLIKRVERLGDFKIDHPVAFTYADRLEIYLIDGETGVLLRGVTSPITQHGSRTPRTTVSDDLGPLVQGSVNGSTPSDLGVPPERQVIAGKSYEQQLVASKDVRLQLLLAPKGAKLQPNGKIVWQTDEKSIGDHSFKVRVEHPDGQRSFVRFVVKVLDVEVARELAQFGEAGRGLELDGDLQSITYDFKAKRHLVLHGDMLTAIGRDGTKVLGKRKPPSTYSLLRERKAYWVASLAHQPTLVYAHRTTLEPIRKISLHSLSLPVRKIVDIALHPNLPIIYAAVECIDQTPRYVILVVDEAEGEVQRNVLLGNWIKIAPDGVRAYTGYHDLYRTGTDFMIDPNWNILDVPTYGSIDMLMQWQLDGMRAEVVRAVTNPGEGGSGLLLSHDGRRVTFESYGGSPGKKDTLASFNSGLTRAVNFKTDRLGKTLALAYHPFLPIVATLQGDEPKLMNRETAEEIEDALLVTGEMPNLENAIRMFFSPDGQALVFALRQKDGKKLSLRALALKQFVLDMKHLPPPEMPKRKTSTRPKRMAQVRRSDIDAMRGMQTKKELKISEIAKDNLDSVVLITTATGAGTGFCVGDEGYIMTAAHVIPRIGNFKVKITNNNRTQEHIGEVLLWNQELDLALVRIPGGPYQSVRFSKRKTLDTGEEVVVIGNPVTGPKILEKTLTSGVVSNPSVEFDNVSHIQTSAAINPGNSGGPMFDRFGCVIGVVSSKALIEGASFVVPVTTVREYLERNLP